MILKNKMDLDMIGNLKILNLTKRKHLMENVF